jgi:hypothetical protein
MMAAAISGVSTMPVHDWTHVDAEIFHDFHLAWIVQIHNALNGGLLPRDYYALTEQHADRPIGGVIPFPLAPPSDASSTLLSRRRTLAIRRVSGHRIAALVEVVSPAIKDRAAHLAHFAKKIQESLCQGVHVLVIDLFPPGPFDRQGMHWIIWPMLDDSEIGYKLPADKPLTMGSYAVRSQVAVYLDHVAVGDSLPDMPLFLDAERYILVPLDQTYSAAFRSMPAYWREVLERQSP